MTPKIWGLAPEIGVLAQKFGGLFHKIEGLIHEILESFSFYNQHQERNFLSIRLVYNGQNRKPIMRNIQRISRPGLRIYTSYKKIPNTLSGLGIVFVSTSQGLLDDNDAHRRKIGGEIFCFLWLFIYFLY